MDWLWSMRLPQCYEPVITTKQMAEQFSKGSILKNRFVVTKSLIDGTSCGASSGGFNVGVVLATEFNGNSVFAIKILPTKNYSPEVTREIGLMQPLSHPNIVRLVDAYAPRLKFELPWIAMEYCALGTLHQFLAKSHQIKLSSKKLISEAFLWQVFKDLAKAIRYCHFGEEDQDGNFGEWDPTYHRDIILGNIFLSKGGRGPLCPCPVIKLGDFGCAVSETELVHRGTRLTYLPDVCQFDWPPEGDVASVAGDVYQVGKVMYSLLTCENPDIAALQGQHWRHDDDYLDLPRARDGPHQYSAQLKGLIDRCLYRYPEGRPSSKELVKLIEPEWRNSLKMPVTLFPWFGNEGD
jgi:serine/threonine protein kinase